MRIEWIFYSHWPGGFPSRKQLFVSRHWRRWSLSPSSPTHPHRYTPHMHSVKKHTAPMSPYTSTHYIYNMSYPIHTTAQIHLTHNTKFDTFEHTYKHACCNHAYAYKMYCTLYVYRYTQYTNIHSHILPIMHSFTIMYICTQCTHSMYI